MTRCGVAALLIALCAVGCVEQDEGASYDEVQAASTGCAPTGPLYAQVNVSNIQAGGDTFRVFQPTPLGEGVKLPLVVFSRGTSLNNNGTAYYDSLLTGLAARGYIVISGDDGNQGEGAQALRALDWAKQNVAEVDATRIGAMGHSQGGNAAVHVGIQRPTEIKAVLALMPGAGTLGNVLGGDVSRADDSALAAPTLYMCGSADLIVPTRQCRLRFNDKNAPAWRATLTQANHFAPANDARVATLAQQWFGARLRGECAASAVFDGPQFSLANNPEYIGVARK